MNFFTKQQKWVKWFRRLVFWPICCLCLLILSIRLLVPVTKFNTVYSTVLLDRKGLILGATTASDGQWRFGYKADLNPKYLKALLTYEDKRFYDHIGIDPMAIVRAFWLNIKAGNVVSGASTLTMQVVRLSRDNPPRTYWEKMIEILMALRLEWRHDKKTILDLYAAHVPFGGNVVGLEAASWRYFGRSSTDLSWAQAAMLAVLPNSPALIHPGRNRKRLKDKRDKLIDRLWQNGDIDLNTAKLAKLEPLPPKPHPITLDAPHLLFRVQTEQRKKKNLTIKTAQIQTTLDKQIQKRTAKTVMRHHAELANQGIHNAAAMILDTHTGDVLSYVGNIHDLTDTQNGNYVDIVTSHRSTGSLLKPFLYAARLQAGEILPHELVPDIPTSIGGFTPENFDRRFKGAVSASMALARSLNVPAVYMLKDFGVDRFHGFLRRLGMHTLFRSSHDYGLSLILGGAEGTLWELTGMYAGLARTVQRNRVSFWEPNYLKDKSSIKHKESQTLLGPAASYLTLEAMLEVVRPGTDRIWRSFSSGRKIAWKTGTSYGFRDAWAIGVTPFHTIGVWIGNADGEGRPNLTGFSAAAPLLFDLFNILPGCGWFEKPSDLTEVTVCVKSGMLASQNCAHTRLELVPKTQQDLTPCGYCQNVHLNNDRSFRVHSDCEAVSNIQTESLFVLPPVMEWFYQQTHHDYQALPPYRPDCLTSMDAQSDQRIGSLGCLYPKENAKIYIPLELDGKRGQTVFEATHRRPETTIYWHLDRQYLGSTKNIHRIALDPSSGRHLLTLVDENGERISRGFRILEK